MAFFRLICPKCGAISNWEPMELRGHRVAPGVYAWTCQVCEHDVEWSPTGARVRKSVKHKKEVGGKGK